MAIVIDNGDTWIESFVLGVPLADPAGTDVSPLQTLERAGHVIASSITPITSFGANDNVEAIGNAALVDQGFGTLSLFEFVTGIRVVVSKQIGTAGATNIDFMCTVHMRKRGAGAGSG